MIPQKTGTYVVTQSSVGTSSRAQDTHSQLGFLQPDQTASTVNKLCSDFNGCRQAIVYIATQVSEKTLHVLDEKRGMPLESVQTAIRRAQVKNEICKQVLRDLPYTPYPMLCELNTVIHTALVGVHILLTANLQPTLQELLCACYDQFAMSKLSALAGVKQYTQDTVIKLEKQIKDIYIRSRRPRIWHSQFMLCQQKNIDRDNVVEKPQIKDSNVPLDAHDRGAATKLTAEALASLDDDQPLLNVPPTLTVHLLAQYNGEDTSTNGDDDSASSVNACHHG